MRRERRGLSIWLNDGRLVETIFSVGTFRDIWDMARARFFKKSGILGHFRACPALGISKSRGAHRRARESLSITTGRAARQGDQWRNYFWRSADSESETRKIFLREGCFSFAARCAKWIALRSAHRTDDRPIRSCLRRWEAGATGVSVAARPSAAFI